MNILFITKAEDFIDPMGIAYLSAVARKRGHSTHLSIIDKHDILQKVQQVKPEVVAFSSVVTGEHEYLYEMSRRIKKQHSCFTIMGGPHTTYYPEAAKEESLDAICIGEGELAFDELLACLESGKSIDKIQGIHTKEFRNEVGVLIQDLDSIPFPDRDLFFKATPLGKFPLKTFMTSRGCPYPCTYCFNRPLMEIYRGKGKYLRRHSVGRVIEEIARIKKDYPLDFVKFEDDLFALRVDEWVEEFAKEYKKHINLPFNCLLRVDTINEDLAKIMKEAGCFSVTMSIDSGDAEYRHKILKRKMPDEEIINGFHAVEKYGIRTMTNCILGLPYSSTETELKAIELCVKSKIDYASFTVLVPYPRTEMGDYCMKEGIMDTSVDSYKMSMTNESPLTCFTQKQKKIQNNLLELGALAVKFPILKHVVCKFLIHLPTNRFFTLINFVTKSLLMKKYIYPVKLDLLGAIKVFIKGIKIELFRAKGERGKGHGYPRVSGNLKIAKGNLVIEP